MVTSHSDKVADPAKVLTTDRFEQKRLADAATAYQVDQVKALRECAEKWPDNPFWSIVAEVSEHFSGKGYAASHRALKTMVGANCEDRSLPNHADSVELVWWDMRHHEPKVFLSIAAERRTTPIITPMGDVADLVDVRDMMIEASINGPLGASVIIAETINEIITGPFSLAFLEADPETGDAAIQVYNAERTILISVEIRTWALFTDVVEGL